MNDLVRHKLSFEPYKAFQKLILKEVAFFFGFDGSKLNVPLNLLKKLIKVALAFKPRI